MTKKIDKKWDRVNKSNLRAKLLDVNGWIRKADELIYSASLLEPKIIQIWDNLKSVFHGEDARPGSTGYIGTFFMLYAFAIENSLKAKIILKNRIKFRKYVEQRGKLPEELKSHDLFTLAKSLDIQIDSSEEDLLRRLSRSAVWAGRYPVPLFSKELGGQQYSNGNIYNDSVYKRIDIEKIKKLFEKIKLAN